MPTWPDRLGTKCPSSAPNPETLVKAGSPGLGRVEGFRLLGCAREGSDKLNF